MTQLDRKSMDLKLIVLGAESIYEGVLDLLKNTDFVTTSFENRNQGALRSLPRETNAISARDRLAADFDRCDTERGLPTVELLCRLPEGCVAFGEHALTVPLMVKPRLRVSDRATEYAAGALLALCTAAGLVTQLLLLLMVQSDCNGLYFHWLWTFSGLEPYYLGLGKKTRSEKRNQ